ncbi:unnamed protein product [Brugia timori]|uniref:Acyl-CoA_dh_N domain-containing protein n=1 Tax=Brugia timori TaxID=42155 RepID=A0A0R3QBE0_9BILA|nr:unnamed protein product [Brugia timori]
MIASSTSTCSFLLKLFRLQYSTSVNFGFDFTDSQQQLTKAARKFVADEVMPVAAKYDKNGEFPWDVLKKAHANGFMNTTIPRSCGIFSVFIRFILLTNLIVFYSIFC